MPSLSLSARARARVLALSIAFSIAGVASAAEIHVLLGTDPADSATDILLSASLAPAQSLTRATGQRTTVAQTSTMAEVMRARKRRRDFRLARRLAGERAE